MHPSSKTMPSAYDLLDDEADWLHDEIDTYEGAIPNWEDLKAMQIPDGFTMRCLETHQFDNKICVRVKINEDGDLGSAELNTLFDQDEVWIRIADIHQ